MNLAHMVGEHDYESFSQQLWHLATSWAGFILTIILGAALLFAVYKITRKAPAKERIKK